MNYRGWSLMAKLNLLWNIVASLLLALQSTRNILLGCWPGWTRALL